MDGMLSQEEINALLNGTAGGEDTAATSASDSLTVEERDAVGEISNICMGTAATTLSTLLNNKVVITTPAVSNTTLEELSNNYDRPCVFVQISYIEGLDGSNILILKESDVKIITDLMMGGDGTNLADELSELHLSAISEAMNQMMGSASTSLSSMLNKKVDISPPVASLIDLNDTIDEATLNNFLSGEFIQVSFRMEIGDLIDSQIMQLYPLDFAKDLYKKFSGAGDTVSEEAAPQSAPTPTPAEAPVQQPVQNMAGTMQQPIMGQPVMMQQPMMQQGMPMQDVNVQPAQFQPFTAAINPLTQQENIDLIMDVPLEVTVELGRTNKSIKEILDFSPGTIIELNKLAGEPIDVLVNGKFVAKGEVVVIEESFGIRVTEIVR
ncbi:flagellar motor switch phosphatase FliY [Velocimicrobium porci]|uniref:Flagellar motor switch phosphatase FliY n=1 Tax=Velocimicrobium porci TaxID=2606634 RepID=A0A6L5XW90_9FIRM|nr:flagellar motor switch phosphatase FliY [Velocimicrobium porci]MSS63002.1 flagellar motor switch phosphatase FliY [Velocimicrobium porci]